MNEEERRRVGFYCEICNILPATEIKGGRYKEERKIFLCCKICKKLIINERLNNAK